MKKIRINWIKEISTYVVDSELHEFVVKTLDDFKQFLNFTKVDIILITFAQYPGFERTLEKFKTYFLNPNDIKNQHYDEDGFALFIPNSLLRDKDLCLIVVKVFKFMRVSILHELFHRLFENSSFKRNYMPGFYLREGENFTYYIEDFFVEFLAIDLNMMKIFKDQIDVEEYQKLNEITEKSICDKSLKIYDGFKAAGGKDLKGLLISLLSCYYIFFSSWRALKGKIPKFEILFQEMWNKILNLKELAFFQNTMTNMMEIFIEEDINQITNRIQFLFNQL